MMNKEKPYKRTASIIRDYLKDNSISNVLDLGCGIPTTLMELYYLNICEDLIAVEEKKIGSEEVYFGIDRLDTLTLIDGVQFYDSKFNQQYENLKTNNWLYNQHLKRALFDGFDPVLEPKFQNLISEEYFETSIDKFLSINKRTYDLIIVSKVLSHYNGNRVNLISNLLDILKNQGRIFLRINFEDFESLNTLNMSELIEIKNLLNPTVDYIERVTDKRTHIILIGNGL